VPLALSGSFAAVKLAQVLLGALLVPAVGRVAGAAFGARARVIAAALTAFYPDLVWFSTHFWSETLFLVALWWSFERLVAAERDASRAAALLAGLLFGLAILTRETALYFAPFAALWLARGSATGRIGRGAAFLAAAVLTVVPWTYRNYVAYDAFVPVSTAGGLNLWQGNAALTREEVYALYAAVPGRIEKYRFAQREGLKAIAARQPAWVFEKLASELPTFFEVDSLALAHLRREAYGPVSRPVYAAAAAVLMGSYLLVLLGFVAGLARAPLGRVACLLLAFLAYYTLLHVATHGFARYRLPAMPVCFAFAASALALRGAPANPVSRGRRVAAWAVALVLVAAVSVSVLERPAVEEAAPQ
jgi:4-amino-4-deoxy-L-arabinose transferase-like glycosyltransferase